MREAPRDENPGGAPPRRLDKLRHALRDAARAIRADHDHLRAMQAKYSDAGSGSAIQSDLVTKIGFQMMAAYRAMRLLQDGGVPVAPKIASRLIRHLYGSDIHWEARFEPGVMIVHGMGLAISRAARVDAGAIINQNVTLGMGIDPESRATGAPHLERNVHVGAGATLVGPITIGAGSKIMPGCVVTRSVPPGSIVMSPAPEVRERQAGRVGGDLQTRPRAV